MILRSLGYGNEILDDYGEPGPLDPCELKGRCLTALAVGGAIADDGMPAVRSGGVVECGCAPATSARPTSGSCPSAIRPRPGALTVA